MTYYKKSQIHVHYLLLSDTNYPLLSDRVNGTKQVVQQVNSTLSTKSVIITTITLQVRLDSSLSLNAPSAPICFVSETSLTDIRTVVICDTPADYKRSRR